MEYETNIIRKLSVDEWHGLSLDGNDVPIRIYLNGDSMRPLIRRQKDVVTIIPLRRPAQPGEIVLFADDRGRYVVHRVWKQKGDFVITLGDHCARPDSPLRREQIWGLVTSVNRGNRKIPVDTGTARWLGRLWMTLLPVRKYYYKFRNRGNGSGRK